LEIQVTTWGYKRSDAMGNCYFKRVKITNKAVSTLAMERLVRSISIACMFANGPTSISASRLTTLPGATALGAWRSSTMATRSTRCTQSTGYPYRVQGTTSRRPGHCRSGNRLSRCRPEASLWEEEPPNERILLFLRRQPVFRPSLCGLQHGDGRWWNMLRGFAPLGRSPTRQSIITILPVDIRRSSRWAAILRSRGQQPTSSMGRALFGHSQWATVVFFSAPVHLNWIQVNRRSSMSDMLPASG